MPAIEAENLRRVYRSTKKEPGVWGAVKGLFTRQTVEVEAVKGFNVSIEQGEIVGFLGPNGAGKTTTIKMLTGVLQPTSGGARVLGYEPWKRDHRMLRQISLVMGNKNQLWWDLPAWDSFLVLKELYDVSQTDFDVRFKNLVELLDIGGLVHTQVRKLSLGERMKCELAAALIYRPQVLFLDEPTLGLDVVSQKRIRDFIKHLHQEEGCTVLLTSHYMQDVEELCDRVIVIDHGEAVFEGSLTNLSQLEGGRKVIRLAFSRNVEQSDVSPLGEIVQFTGDSASIEIDGSKTAQIVGAAFEKLPIQDVAIEEVALEQILRNLFSRK